jgi:hypothetical protein
MQLLSLWFGAFMIILVISLAAAFTFTDFYLDRLFGNKRTAFIFVLIAYAVYRSFRIYQVLKYRKANDA